ncbi:MAG: hypothetical protein ACYS1A_11785 [Planctomycetota bacterium]|jgi:tetratricopeptide (TPR) repeat protein
MSEGQVNEVNKRQIIRQVIQNWVEVGAKQYERGFYQQAEKSFLQALEYREYLTAAEHIRIDKLLKKTGAESLGRKRITEYIQTAKELIERGELITARAYLERIKDSKSLSKTERKQIIKSLGKLQSQLNKQKKEITELYKRSVSFYRKGQFEKARAGFVRVAKEGFSAAPPGKSAEDYLVQIEAILKRKAEPQVIKEPSLPSMKAVAEPVKKQDRNVEVGGRSKNIRQSYTRAVVEDSVIKAQDYVNQGKFYKAKEALEFAERIVNENRMYLGDEFFRQYSEQLKQLTEVIVEGRKRWLGD